jgi:hypothetical protein
MSSAIRWYFGARALVMPLSFHLATTAPRVVLMRLDDMLPSA